MGASPERGASPGEVPVAGTRKLKPRDAATLVVIDRSGGAPRILMGRRRPSQVFLPDKFVFPGGRVERTDRSIASSDELDPVCVARLLHDMKGTPSPARARALALAAIRETFEEAGLAIGSLRTDTSSDHGASTSLAATWTQFLATGCQPRLSELTFFARAITPPSRPRRYDTRFFMADAAAIVCRSAACDGELGELGWFTIDEMRALDLPNITRAVVEDLAQRLANTNPDMPVPYYRFRHGSFRRDLIG